MRELRRSPRAKAGEPGRHACATWYRSPKAVTSHESRPILESQIRLRVKSQAPLRPWSSADLASLVAGVQASPGLALSAPAELAPWPERQDRPVCHGCLDRPL